ncbi:TonB-dependent receptor plug domain-containing protein [Algoriphagus sp.]|uniref:TonB-dependent receptor plug domain-containing protein n=1 Tax=Algoriphagus sp. TaxID=1872435 RepID=UPI00391AA1D2
MTVLIKTKPKKFTASLVFGILALLLISFSAENDPFEKIIAAFERYIAEHPEEKVYLHYDRPYYAAGETIWFKAYLTAGPYHLSSSLSNTIYVELINNQNQIIQRQIIHSSEGFASGMLHLSESLNSGNYLLRAYTNWMRNSGEEYFFHSQLKIWNSLELNESPISQDQSGQTGRFDLQFFPEGGNLVNGIMSKVAFKAIGEDGLGRVVKGKILERGRILGEFESNPLGMGVFPLLPEKGKTYTAQIEGSEQELFLPIALNKGIVMSVTNSPKTSDLLIKIQASENVAFQTINLLAQTRGLVCASSKADLSNRVIFVRIPKEEFPSGIAQLTAIDENGIPLAERLVFIDHRDQLEITVTTDKPNYAPREAVRLTIETKNKESKPMPANLSLTVFDSEQVISDVNRQTIESNLLISSELKGYIESPGYYFNPANKDKEIALDYLMLTQGWRKFTIVDALSSDRKKQVHRIEKGLTLKGQLTDTKTNKPIENGTVSYLSLFPITESSTISTGENGEFEFQDLFYFDSTKVTLTGKPKNGRTPVSLSTVGRYPSPPLKYPILSYFSSPSDVEKDFISKNLERKNINRAFDFEEDDVILEGIEIQGKKIEDQYTGPRIYGDGSIKVKVADNPVLENLQHPLDLIRGRVAGVQVVGGGMDWKVLIQGVNSIGSSIEPLILLDDVEIKIVDLSSIPVMEIESYTVWKGPDAVVFGSRGANGAIGFYTRRGIVKPSPLNQVEASLVPAGYQFEQEFYSPKYTTDEPPQAKPDKRITLFWEPHIQTDSTGKASLLFYNADVETVVQGEIVGISRNGSPGTSRFSYKVGK